MDLILRDFTSRPMIMYWVLLLYACLVIYTIIKILLDTSSASKTLAYLLLVIVLPLFGPLFYYAFGINTRRGRSNKQMGANYNGISKNFN